MIEVFKTNVQDPGHARILIAEIGKTFADYEVNFDLDDCDNILRVKCSTGSVESFVIVNMVKNCGYNAEILADDLPFNIPPQSDPCQLV